jgi:hypothetical protein
MNRAHKLGQLQGKTPFKVQKKCSYRWLDFNQLRLDSDTARQTNNGAWPDRQSFEKGKITVFLWKG